MAGKKRPVDARAKLAADPFAYRVTAAGLVIIERGGRTVANIGGTQAEKLAKALETADDCQSQLLLAKATGNYKR